MSVWLEPIILSNTIYRCNTISVEVTTALLLGFISMTPELLTPKAKVCVYIMTKKKKKKGGL